MNILYFFLLKIKLQQLLCLAFMACVCACASQQGKPRLKERPQVVRQMLEDRDFKIDFTWFGGDHGPDIPFYMQISGDTLLSFMVYDTWSRQDLEYVYDNPRKHGRPFPSKYIISDYEVTDERNGVRVVKFSFPIPLKMKGEEVIIPSIFWNNGFIDDNAVYGMKEVRVQCEMDITPYGNVSFHSFLVGNTLLHHNLVAQKGVLLNFFPPNRKEFWSDKGSIVF